MSKPNTRRFPCCPKFPRVPVTPVIPVPPFACAAGFNPDLLAFADDFSGAPPSLGPIPNANWGQIDLGGPPGVIGGPLPSPPEAVPLAQFAQTNGVSGVPIATHAHLQAFAIPDPSGAGGAPGQVNNWQCCFRGRVQNPLSPGEGFFLGLGDPVLAPLGDPTIGPPVGAYVGIFSFNSANPNFILAWSDNVTGNTVFDTLIPADNNYHVWSIEFQFALGTVAVSFDGVPVISPAIDANYPGVTVPPNPFEVFAGAIATIIPVAQVNFDNVAFNLGQ